MTETETETFRLIKANRDETLFTGTEADAFRKWAREGDNFAYMVDAEGNFMAGDTEAAR